VKIQLRSNDQLDHLLRPRTGARHIERVSDVNLLRSCFDVIKN